MSAQVVVTEIMYDLPKDSGSDTGREWVEVFNDSNESIDLSGWRFYEADVNHKLKLFQGNSTLPALEYAIIADNPEKFLVDNSSFSGVVFDSSFSLKNTGETIVLRNADLIDIDSVTYSSEQGAKGNGNSLQKTDGGWIATTPTPGSSSLEVGFPSVQVDNQSSSEEAQVKESLPPVVTSGGSWPVEPQIFTRVKTAPKVAVVGADVLFEGDTLGLKKEPLEGARYLWTLGDGGTKEGQKIFYHYNYPGKYIVVLNASSGTYSASDRVVIEAIPADVEISSVGVGSNSFVEIYNKTKYELNISWWRLRASSEIFTIPKDTIILPESKIIFPSQHTEFEIKTGDSVELLYPNGVVAHPYVWEPNIKVVQTPQTVVTPISTNGSVQGRTLDTPPLPVKTNPVKPSQADDVDIKKKKEIAEDISKESQVANVFTVTNNSGSIYKWLLGVTGISALSIFSVLLTRKEKFTEDLNISAEADEYEIVEE